MAGTAANPITFDQMPAAIATLIEGFSRIEAMLAASSPNATIPVAYDPPLGSAEAADYLGLTLGTLNVKVSKGEIPSNKKGGRNYFYRSELDAYIRSGKRKTKSEIQAEADKYCSKK